MIKRILTALFSLFFIGTGGILIYIFRLNVPRHIVNAATVFGTLFGCALIAVGVLLPRILKGVYTLWKKKAGKIALCSLGALMLAGICGFCAMLGIILSAQNNTASAQKTLIVLGCQVRGTTPSQMLALRTDAAYDYLQQNPDAVAILSGGQGADEDISEAQCIFLRLTEKGISPDRLFLEDSSTNTDENIRNSLAIIQRNHLSKAVAVATSDFHQKRAAIICARYGLSAAAVNAKTPGYLVPVFYTREIFALVKESVF